MAFKQGSRKAQVFDVYQSKGLDAAIEFAVSLGLKAGSVKSWAAAWRRLPSNKGRQAASVTAKPVKGVPEQKAPHDAPDSGYSPDFRYAHRGDAVRRLMSIARRPGCDQRAFHVVEERGKFAVVPASYRPEGPIPQFERGDHVMDTVIPNSRARVIAAGPEQCEIEYFDGIGSTMYKGPANIPNVYLFKVAKTEPKVRKAIKPSKSKVAVKKPNKSKKK